MAENVILTGDCVEVMAGFEAESVDAIVCDPPYGLEFMGKAWDKLGAGLEVAVEDTDSSHPFRNGARRVRFGASARSMQSWHEAWAREALRVARPSSYLLAFGGTRTVHRMTTAIEDAGWIIRDMLVWAYASGFPKSKASLKPAWEPIVMARKPGPLQMLAIDECRIPFESPFDAAAAAAAAAGYSESLRLGHIAPSVSIGKESRDGTEYEGPDQRGRWPANVLLTDPIFDGDTSGVVGGGATNGGGLNHLLRRGVSTGAGLGYGSSSPEDAAMVGYDDSGTYSRFFLVPKADRADREPVLHADREPVLHADRELPFDDFNRNVGNTIAARRENSHPTVKPTDLMRHLVRLVTPAGGLVLDPFLGSGTTALACELEGFRWLGIEREPEYVAIAEARLNGTQRGLGLVG